MNSRHARESEPGNRQDRQRLTILLAFAGVVYLALIVRGSFGVDGKTYFTLVDDTMISMRYAANLAHGDGMVWNVGEEPIQGFTNLGYVLVMAVFHLLPIPARFLSLLPITLTTLALLGTAAATHRVVRALRPQNPGAALLAAAAVAFNFGLVFWSTRGMEVSLITLPLMVAMAIAVGPTPVFGRATRWIAYLSAFAILVRLDAAPSFVLIFLALLWSARSQRPRLRDTVFYGLIPAGTLIGVLGFQRFYFGDLLPNTYYLKAEGVTVSERLEVGWKVFVDNAMPELAVLFLLALTGYLFGRSARRSDTPYGLLAACSIVPILYSIWVGGDYAEPQVHAPNRFMLMAVPPLIVLAILGLSDLAERVRASGAAAAAGALLLGLMVLGLPNLGNWNELAFGEIPLWPSDRDRTQLGVHLAAATPPEVLVATHTAGQIPYYSERSIIDLLGKSDRAIAHGAPAAPFRPGHNKWDYDYSIGVLRPDVVADEWGSVADFLGATADYERLDNGLWVSSSPSVALDLVALGACYTCDE